jgi:hypothetical protein
MGEDTQKKSAPKHSQPACQIKDRLLEQLSAAALDYAEAICRLIDVAGNGRGAEFARLKIEARIMHEHCEQLMADLSAHSAEHGC